MQASRHPIQDLLDLLGRRWALRVLWELRSGAPQTFGQLRASCEQVSTSVLTTRLTELVDARIVAKDAAGYRLTDEGAELLALLGPLDAFAKRWAAKD